MATLKNVIAKALVLFTLFVLAILFSGIRVTGMVINNA
jgi:hypothetical protein